jgi:3-oxoacyl-[acyl-carrier protein] reductase
MKKTAMITGASRGIGRAAAIRFAEAGYNLILTCIRQSDTLRQLAETLEKEHGIRCLAMCADMGNYEDVCRIFESVTDLDVLVNNAGIAYFGLLSEMSPEDWDRVMRTNLDACFYTSKLAIPHMLRKQSGRIINVSSVWGSTGASMEVAYSASKGGVNTFTKALARELAPSNIQVNAIACGIIDTDMNAHLTEDEILALKDEIPADRLGSPDEVAQLILQTAQAPSYMTGQIITIDGGWC